MNYRGPVSQLIKCIQTIGALGKISRIVSAGSVWYTVELTESEFNFLVSKGLTLTKD